MGIIKLAWLGIGRGFAWIAVGTRWMWAVGLAILLLIGVLVFQVRQGHSENKSLKTALSASQGEVDLLRQARKADGAAITENLATKATIKTKEDHGRNRTIAALKRHPDWANTPVPADVLGSLRED